MFDVKYFEKVVYLGKSNRLKESFISTNFTEFYKFITNNFQGESFLEKIYVFVNGEHVCYCGNKTKFISFRKGYLKYCSIVCSSNSKETRQKYKNTCLSKYGVDNVSSNDDIKYKKKKTFIKRYGKSTYLQTDHVKKVMIDRYGVDNIFKLSYVQDEIKKTNLDKYGVEYTLQSDIIRDRIKETNLKKYGVDHFSKTDKWKSIIKKTNDESYIKSLSLPKNYLFISKDKYINTLKHIDCDNIFTIQTQLVRLRIKKGLEICRHCNNISYHSENSLRDYIKTIYDGEVNKYRDRNYEIDIYLPEMKLGFEFNGLYWHSELFKDSNYHINKMKYFKEKGIRLINIWEDDWLYKGDIIKSIIISNICKHRDRIYARKCEISKISHKECKEFLNNNHIQGWCVSKHRYALKYKGEIVSVLTIGNRRLNLGYKSKDSNRELEILRFCNKINVSVVGGFSKLLKSLTKEIEISKIITYSDISIFTGDVYLKNGFKIISESNPGYYYIVNGIRRNRFNFNKSKLIKMGFDKNKTEREIMFDKNYYRIYDCGNLKLEYNIE
jgi:hypothetical protein